MKQVIYSFLIVSEINSIVVLHKYLNFTLIQTTNFSPRGQNSFVYFYTENTYLKFLSVFFNTLIVFQNKLNVPGNNFTIDNYKIINKSIILSVFKQNLLDILNFKADF